MANYKQHLAGGIFFGTICTLVSVFVFGFTIVNSLTIFILGVLGSILPDIDCDGSTPAHMLFEVMGLLVPILFLNRFLSNLSLENIIFFLVFGYIFTKFFLSFIFHRFTVHRGIVHSIPAAVIIGGMVFLAFKDTSFYLKLIYALACTGGFIVHLTMDEIWAVDICNNRLKNSFGTALTFWSHSLVTTSAAYIIIICMAFHLYYNVKIPGSFDIEEGRCSTVPELTHEKLKNTGWADRFLIDINSTWPTLCKRYFKS
ncbi:metal-dependent hydrolase [Lentisphaerota bacterium ZTH]|nr:metal-dependent hydrolase [Lentisphaerota bacterium]WET07319.1 metal-dependent hydrolase [Lentisphaerota bacterium ZTH]